MPPPPGRVIEYFAGRRGTLSQLTPEDLTFNDRLWRKACGLPDEMSREEELIAAQDARFPGARGALCVTGRCTDVLAPERRVTHKSACDEPGCRSCARCGRLFWPRRPQTIHCSSACRQKAYRLRANGATPARTEEVSVQ